MSKIFKYKKSLIFGAILLMTIIVGLCFLSYQSRVLLTDDNNEKYCYNIKDVPLDGDMSGIKNAIKISTYNGEFSSAKMLLTSIDDDSQYEINLTATFIKEILHIGWIVADVDVFNKIEVYILHNLIDEMPKEWIPSVHYSLSDTAMNINIDRSSARIINFDESKSRMNIIMLVVLS